MKLTHIHEKVNANGSVERLSSDFTQDEVILGRGGASHIILISTLVSLVHAKIFQDGDKFCISDLNSLSGVRVNGARVAHAVLSSGDSIQLGDVSFSVALPSGGITLTQRSTVVEEEPAAEVIDRQVARLTLDSYLPRMRVLSGIISVVVAAGCLAIPILRNDYKSWNSGPISNHHRTIEKDCKRCHGEPFERVQDQQCLSCHKLTEHAKTHGDFIKRYPGLSMRCAECHMEHNGDHGLISKDSRPCVSCHGGMTSLQKEAKILDVVSFDSHPQFRLSLKDAAGNEERVSLDNMAKLIDSTPIKLNHEIHLKAGLRGPRGPETLQCNACHQLAPDKRNMAAISFDKHCRDCHSLGFDERLPDSQVPHGNADAVYPTLFAEYAKLLLLSGGNGGARGGDKLRVMPGGTQLPPDKILPPDAQLVQVDARRAEEELFTKTGCFLCHDFKEKPLSEQTSAGSRYTVTRPQIPIVWMTKARFNHGSHEAVSCESCHDKTRKSTETKDVLLPGIKVCRECHMERPKAGFVRADCVQCHVYHASLEVPRDKKQSISDFLHVMSR